MRGASMLLLLFEGLLLCSWAADAVDPKLHLITVATEETDGLRRLQKGAEKHGHTLHILGMGQRWQGGSMAGLGGGQKVRLLREHLSDAGLSDNTVVLFVDAYDVVITADPVTILTRFVQEFQDKKVVFGAEHFCWPDRSLAPTYPVIKFGQRYLNSGLFIGYVREIETIVALGEDLYDYDDDQLFYTKLYLDEGRRTKLAIGLDHLSLIFQNLNGAGEDVKIEYDEQGHALLFNAAFNTHPIVLHGNGPAKYSLNFLENYVDGAYVRGTGCARCGHVEVKDKLSTYPIITLAVFIAKPICFVEEFFEALLAYDYPKDHIDLFIYNNQQRTDTAVKDFVEKASKEYRSVQFKDSEAGICEYSARNEAFHFALQQNSEFVFTIDADVYLKPLALVHLIQRAIEDELRILTPMVMIKNRTFSNFWGAISSTGYYERSTDYMDITEGAIKGFFNVPFVSSALLITAAKLPYFIESYNYNKKLDADMSFAKLCRDKGHFLYVDNQEDYGFIVATEFFSSLSDDVVYPEVLDYPNNRDLWEARYIHPLYHDLLKEDTVVDQACPDVYDFPFLTERFCTELIEIMENFGQWSDGSNYDKRLDGGYENVPTRDIHMKQVGFERQWLQILDDYVAPLQEKIFIGYYQRPVKANMMFVVRYRPDEQPSLRPHHDASTYSIDIALNRRGVDYEGGGVRYVRYNCTVPADEPGYAMLFPGRLTHLHEGLPTTKGTRYILVSFINP